ncbi:hypothetical protein [Terriglobus roseus]|nr:hypothetical protein [Terriglobus roseus]
MQRFMRAPLATLMVFVCLLFTTGCHVVLVMGYDDVVDHGLNQVQQDTEQFLGQLEADTGTPAASYDNTKTFYIREDAALKTVRTRVQFQPKSTEVLTQIDALTSSLHHLQTLHRSAGPNGPSLEVVELASAPLESEFASIARLQVALRTRLKGVPPNATAPPISK